MRTPDPSPPSREAAAPSISIVIPAFNEADRLPPTLERIESFLQRSPRWRPSEIVVVDDGSSDATAENARSRKQAEGVEVVVVTHAVNRGKGAAVRTGFATSSGRWVLLTDADLSAPIEDLDLLADGSDEGTVAVGSRAVDRRLIAKRQPAHRDLMGRTFNLMLRVLGLTRMHDTQCGFKLFPGEAARALASVQRLDGFAYDVELLVLAAHWGYRLEEIGVRWQHVEASRVLAVRHSSEMLRDALRIWWWGMAGRLPSAPRNGP